MKKYNYDEFKSRLNEIHKARQIFNHLTDNDITKSWEAYQIILAEEESDLFIQSSMTPANHNNKYGNYKLPQCLDCGMNMQLKINQFDQDGVLWKTAWVCRKCENIYYSDKDPHEWEMELK